MNINLLIRSVIVVTFLMWLPRNSFASHNSRLSAFTVQNFYQDKKDKKPEREKEKKPDVKEVPQSRKQEKPEEVKPDKREGQSRDKKRN